MSQAVVFSFGNWREIAFGPSRRFAGSLKPKARVSLGRKVTKIGRRSQIRLLVSGVLDINRAKPLSLGERKVREVKNLYIGASLGQVPAKFGEHFFSALNAQLGADKNDDLKLCPYRKECGVQSRFRMTFRANRCQKDLRGGNQAFGFLSSSQIYFLRALVIGAGFPVDRRAMNSPGRRPNRCVSMRRSFRAAGGKAVRILDARDDRKVFDAAQVAGAIHAPLRSAFSPLPPSPISRRAIRFCWCWRRR